MPRASSSTAGKLPGRFERLLREVLLLALLGLALSVLLILFSFHPADPGWSSTGSGESIRNLFGPVGAWVADVMLSLFGYVALLGAVGGILLVLQAWRRLHRDPDATIEHHTPGVVLRGTAAVAAVVAATALSAQHVVDNASMVPQGAGGIVGSELSAALVGLLNPVGATLLLLIVLAVALPIVGMFSWLAVFERVGAWASAGWEQWQARREARAEEKARREAEERPRLAPTLAAGPAATETAPAAKPTFTLPRKKPRRTRRKAETRETQLALDIDEEKGADVPPYDGGDPRPPLEILDPPRPPVSSYSEGDLEQISRHLEEQLAHFNVDVEVVNAQPGPVVTRFELKPAPGVKGSQITNLSRDLARALSVASVRVVEVIAGKSVIGLEIPNRYRDVVSLTELLASPAYQSLDSPLTIALGKDISGHPLIFDLARMPHLMVAGTTGSGKSVAINTMILSILYKATADQLRFIFIDPKMLELSVYEGIPHLLTPVVTDMKDAANALRWSVGEMERRYQLMTRLGVRNIAGLNKKIRDAAAAGRPIPDPLQSQPLFADGEEDPDAPSPPDLEPMPHIVIVIDELADMMMVVGKKVEELIARIAQKARAAGIHMIVATQRPSVDVITGLIKANIPSRLAFQVASRIDSRTILDEMGAETLLGNGDGLFRPVGANRLDRVHGAFVDDHEVHKVVRYLKQVGEPEYIENVCAPEPDAGGLDGNGDAEQDPLYDQAVAIVIESGKASTSWVQRRLKIGYNRAARIIEQMEASGIVGPSGPGGNRDILVQRD